jgi:hypothetical protein
MENDVKETSNLHPKSIKLSKSLLSELCHVLDNVHSEFLNDEKQNENDKKYASVEYKLETKSKEIETSDSASFLKNWNPKKFRECKLQFRGGERWIWIRCQIGYLEGFTVSVEGKESVWVNGITRKFEEILEKYKSKSEFFHSKKAYLIYLGIPLICLIGLYIILTPTIQELGIFVDEETKEESSLLERVTRLLIIVIFGMGLVSTFGVPGLFHWLFPKIELENNIQIKIRKGVLSALGVLIISLIAGGIISLITNP